MKNIEKVVLFVATISQSFDQKQGESGYKNYQVSKGNPTKLVQKTNLGDFLGVPLSIWSSAFSLGEPGPVSRVGI